MEAQFQQMQQALSHVQSKTTELETKLAKGNESSAGLIGAIRKGQVKGIAPRKFGNVHTSGTFQPWARAMNNYVYWHDAGTINLIEGLENQWAMDARLSRAKAVEICLA